MIFSFLWCFVHELFLLCEFKMFSVPLILQQLGKVLAGLYFSVLPDFARMCFTIKASCFMLYACIFFDFQVISSLHRSLLWLSADANCSNLTNISIHISNQLPCWTLYYCKELLWAILLGSLHFAGHGQEKGWLWSVAHWEKTSSQHISY